MTPDYRAAYLAAAGAAFAVSDEHDFANREDGKYSTYKLDQAFADADRIGHAFAKRACAGGGARGSKQ